MKAIDTVKFDPERAKYIDFTAPIARSGNVVVGTYYGEYSRALYVGGAGDITVEKWDGTTQEFKNVPEGAWFPVCSMRVTAATASDLVWGA